MKWIARVFVFTATLVFGIFAATLFWFSGLTYIFAVPPSVEHGEPSPAQTHGGIKVMYTGWESGQDGGGPYLKFIILNGQDTPVSYRAHSSESPFPQMKANGIDIQHTFRCGTGMQDFQILPGGSAEFQVSRYEFLERPNAADKITVGFYLKSPSDEEGETYYSEPFQLPDEYRASIPRTIN